MSASTSGDAKDAIARALPADEHCREALRGALVLYGGRDGGTVFRTQRPAIARLFWSLLAHAHGRAVRKEAGTRLLRRPSYAIDVPATLQFVPPKPSKRCDRRAEIAGAFLACGSLASPGHGYHLEFVPPRGAVARLRALLAATGFPPKAALRKNHTVLYYKDADAVSEILSSMGAFGAVLHLEDVRAYKETKNRIQRLVNTDAANVERAANAGALQRHAITYLASAYGLRRLSPALREIAELRLNHPDETLAELGRRCRPAVGKSAVNGRIAALLRLCERLKKRPPSGA